MSRLLGRYATPLTTGFFLISLVTGAALFVHVGPTAFREMHEILSMVLILPFALHLWKNWRPLVGYFRHAPMAIALALSLAASALFFLPATGESGTSGPPPFALANAVIAQPLADVAPALGLSPEDLSARLTAAGFTLSTPDQTLAQIATASGKDSMDLMAALVSAAAPASE